MLIRSGIVVASLTMLSRIFGMLRELFIAATFGTGPIADSVNVAFKLPNLFRRIFGEGALASIFAPMFTEKLASSEDLAEKFASKVFFFLSIVLIIFTLLVQYFMPELMVILAPGFKLDHAKYDLTIFLCRVTMPYLLFISLTALIGGMLNSIGRFAAFAISPVLMNIVIISGGFVGGKYIPSAHAIAWSVALAGLLQLLLILFSLSRSSLSLKTPHFSHQDQDIKKLLKLMVPATMSSGVTQVNLFISQSISSFIPGAVSILSYADRIYQLPMSIIGVTFGTILLPTLSKLYKSNQIEEAKKTQEDAIKIGLFLSAPCSAVIIVLAYPIIRLIYEHGVFTAEDTIRTGDAIAAFALGLPAFVLCKIFMPIFYAHQDAKTPLRITCYTIVANIILNIIFMIPFAHVGIALGSSIASWYNLWLFVKYAKRHGYFTLKKELGYFTAKIFINTLLCSVSMLLIYHLLVSHLGYNKIIYQVINVFAAIGSGFCVYIAVSIITGVLDRKILTKLLPKYAKKI